MTYFVRWECRDCDSRGVAVGTLDVCPKCNRWTELYTGGQMDPNAALERLRRLAAQVKGNVSYRDSDSIFLRSDFASASASAADMADLFEALDGWISRGGFLPNAWRR